MQTVRMRVRAPRLFLIALAILALLTGCGGSSSTHPPGHPGKVAATVLEALSEEDVAKACQLMDAKMHDNKPGRQGAYGCEQTWLHIDNTPWSWKPTPGAVSEWGTPDVVVTHIYYGKEGTAVVMGHRRGGTLRREVELKREDGRWLVSRVESPI